MTFERYPTSSLVTMEIFQNSLLLLWHIPCRHIHLCQVLAGINLPLTSTSTLVLCCMSQFLRRGMKRLRMMKRTLEMSSCRSPISQFFFFFYFPFILAVFFTTCSKIHCFKFNLLVTASLDCSTLIISTNDTFVCSYHGDFFYN